MIVELTDPQIQMYIKVRKRQQYCISSKLIFDKSTKFDTQEY